MGKGTMEGTITLRFRVFLLRFEGKKALGIDYTKPTQSKRILSATDITPKIILLYPIKAKFTHGFDHVRAFPSTKSRFWPRIQKFFL